MSINIEQIAKATGIADIELLKGFVRDFFQICIRDIECIHEYISKDDSKMIIHHSQNIHGAASRLKLEEISQTALSLITAAENMEKDKYSQLYYDLKTVFDSGYEEYKNIK